jgi:acyl-homoserine lactone acylase PvdQ
MRHSAQLRRIELLDRNKKLGEKRISKMAGPSQAHLDVLAKQLGFRDYATYSAYQRQQAMMRKPRT